MFDRPIRVRQTPPQVSPFFLEEVEDLKRVVPRTSTETEAAYDMRILNMIAEYEMKATDAMGDLLEDSHYFENDGANWGFD